MSPKKRLLPIRFSWINYLESIQHFASLVKYLIYETRAVKVLLIQCVLLL